MAGIDGFVTTLSELDVSNVFVYVGDAVRWDGVPEEVCERGAALRTVAGSTWSPSSFATIATGLYTPAHGVNSFSDRIPAATPTLFDEPSTGRFLNSIFEFAARVHGQETDPIYSVLGVDPPSVDDPFDGLESPFICVERGPGGHAPWGDFSGGAPDYFEENRAATQEQLRADYERSLALDAELFADRLDRLADAGLLDDTLVIYTSDHGEVVGERGLLGHSGPMVPELVHVPTVFVHPDISETRPEAVTVHHADLLPTIRSVLDSDVQSPVDGVDLTAGLPRKPRPCHFEHSFLPPSVPLLSGTLRYDGVWDHAGGHVFRRNSTVDGLGVYLAKLVKSSKKGYMRRNLLAGLRCYTAGTRTFGTPDHSRAEAESILSAAVRSPEQRTAGGISDSGKEQLEKLGYL